MNKFKVGDKVVVTEESTWGLVGTEGIIVFNPYSDNNRYKITGGTLDGDKIRIGREWSAHESYFKLMSEVKKKDQKQLPLCYAEEQEKIQEELNSKSEEIEDIFSPEAFGGQVVFSEGEFNIDGVFDITQVKALNKWLTKMTATPKKKGSLKVVAKKVTKKVSKKKAKAVK